MKNLSRHATRVIVFFIALLFLTIAMLPIYQLYQDHQNQKAATKTQEKAMSQLQGTQLANFTPVVSIPSLQVIDTTVGTGEAVKAGDTVTVDYTGAVAATGIIFQSSKDSGQPVSFPLSGVIAGWSQGIPGMKVGGTRRLLIPAALAYGPTPPQGSGIPANADLVFDVTLHKIGK